MNCFYSSGSCSNWPVPIWVRLLARWRRQSRSTLAAWCGRRKSSSVFRSRWRRLPAREEWAEWRAGPKRRVCGRRRWDAGWCAACLAGTWCARETGAQSPRQRRRLRSRASWSVFVGSESLLHKRSVDKREKFVGISCIFWVGKRN